MKLQLTVVELESGTEEKVNLIRRFSASYLENTFLDKDYGSDVETIMIIICVIQMRPGFENWYKVKRPKYTEYKSWYTTFGIDDPDIPEFKEIKKRFDIEIRFKDQLYDDFMDADEEEAKRIAAEEEAKRIAEEEEAKRIAAEEEAKRILARETLKALELLDKLPKRLKNFDKERFKADVAAYYREQGWIE